MALSAWEISVSVNDPCFYNSFYDQYPWPENMWHLCCTNLHHPLHFCIASWPSHHHHNIQRLPAAGTGCGDATNGHPMPTYSHSSIDHFWWSQVYVPVLVSACKTQTISGNQPTPKSSNPMQHKEYALQLLAWPCTPLRVLQQPLGPWKEAMTAFVLQSSAFGCSASSCCLSVP